MFGDMSALDVPVFSAYLPGANAKVDVNAMQQKLRKWVDNNRQQYLMIKIPEQK